MALNVMVVPGAVMAPGDLLTPALVNQVAQPTVAVAGNLNQLTDVAATGQAEGQPLVWNVATGKWIPGTVGRAYEQTMQGATAVADGGSGAAPQALIADREKVLSGAGTWVALPSNPAASANTLFMSESFI